MLEGLGQVLQPEHLQVGLWGAVEVAKGVEEAGGVGDLCKRRGGGRQVHASGGSIETVVQCMMHGAWGLGWYVEVVW